MSATTEPIVESKSADKKPAPLTVKEILAGLKESDKTALDKAVEQIKKSDEDAAKSGVLAYDAFAKKVEACVAMKGLLGDNYRTYAREKLGYQKTHAHRLLQSGQLLKRLSPQGDARKILFSELHVRPMTGLSNTEQDTVLATLKTWQSWVPGAVVTPKWVEAAVICVKLAGTPEAEQTPKAQVVAKVLEVIAELKHSLPDDDSKPVEQFLAQLEKKVKALAQPPRKTGIDWTTATWNPLHGCGWASEGCDHCYAAKLMATRMASRYPGLARKTEDDSKPYLFAGKILLDPRRLAEPLADLVPKRYFVNSMSDLFHGKVPDEFIAAVFDVMEKASWHQFQVLTKRPEKMAKFTTLRYATRTPPAHIWLGASTENQEAFDKRHDHLRNTKAAVRWLSCEPLLGPIKLGKCEGIDWVVVGGESGSTRQMQKEWATSLRDQCAKHDVTFFFKQWGDYNEQGERKKAKKDGLTPPTLEGEIHNNYPAELPTPTPKQPAAVTPKRGGKPVADVIPAGKSNGATRKPSTPKVKPAKR